MLAPLAVGCLFDPDDRCDSHEEFAEGDRCVCREGYARVGNTCVACGPHERSASGGCECEPGYSRGPDGTCGEPTSLGRDCDVDAPCDDPSADHCQAVEGTSGYCTIAHCATSEDCPGLYECDTTADPSFCQRPPSGLTESCSGPQDCAGFEAGYCEQVQSHSCLVSDCTPGGSDCFLGWSCCDLTSVGLPTLCVKEGTCPF